jgi:hypothetical protein
LRLSLTVTAIVKGVKMGTVINLLSVIEALLLDWL